jgi:hypothetical protein
MPGFRLRYTRPNAGLALVPLLHKPFFGQSLDTCPTCHVIHPVKVVHLWLEPDGHVTVSAGVLDDLRKAGLPDLVLVNEVKKPPPLKVGKVPRQRVDYDNRTTRLYVSGFAKRKEQPA